MRKDFYAILAVVLAAFAYGCFCTASMLFGNKLPAYLACEGVALDTGRVYVVGSAATVAGDTVAFVNEQTAMLMPSRLCSIRYNRERQHFELVNADEIAPSGANSAGPFHPFCRTLNDGIFQRGIYWGPGAVVPEQQLLDRGLKYNITFGNRSTRTGLQFQRFEGHLVLSLKHEGIGVIYPLHSGKENSFSVLVNAPDTSQQRLVFAFTRAGARPESFLIAVRPRLFGADYSVSDKTGAIVLEGNEARPRFLLGGYLFSVKYKYGLPFTIRFLVYGLLLVIFQVFFLYRLWKASSPVIRSLLAFRILLNAIACLAVPLFLASYYMTSGREWYLLLVLMVNLSFMLPKDLFNWRGFRSKLLYASMAVVIVTTPVLIRLFTYNESLFGLIPVLHCAKLAILMLFYMLEISWFRQSKAHYIFRLSLILAYALMLSLLSGDTGTFIYTAMAVVIVELIKTTLRMRVLITGILCVVLLCYVIYEIRPGITADRKFYRIYAPYVDPSSDRLAGANEADRESYTTFLLDLKSIQRLETPQFNELLVPANMRSTMHTDFAFHWSMMFGGLVLVILYLGVTLLLVKHVAFLLFCAARECRVSGELCFSFPKSRVAESVRILLAFTLVSFVFPVLSNLLLIPVTGQSIPFLSISIIEPAFIILLLAALENIFNNREYYIVKPQVRYTYKQMLAGFQWSFALISVTFLICLAAKCLAIWYLPETYAWKKMGSEAAALRSRELPARNDKAGLAQYGSQVIAGAGGPGRLSIAQKELLLNLAACYYTGKPYFQAAAGGGVFSNSRPRLLQAMTADSLGRDRQRRISGKEAPYGLVYSFVQRLNDKPVRKVTNRLYATIPAGARAVNGDLSAELNTALSRHLALTGVPANIGAIMVVDNQNGHVIANSLCPLQAAKDANEVYYFVGSLKKLLVAYCALAIDTNYRHAVFNGKTFDQFIRYSDDQYAAFLLKNLLINHREELDAVLTGDFSLPLVSATSDAYLDALPAVHEFTQPLDRKNSIYRLAIGQQRPYPLLAVAQWYSRVASGRRVMVNYGDSVRCQALTMDTSRLKLFREIFNGVLTGTAAKVGVALNLNGIGCGGFFCKTGTAESVSHSFNASSSFVIANREYTIAIMLSGRIPHNDEGLAAKDLFIKVIPLLLKYHILQIRHTGNVLAKNFL